MRYIKPCTLLLALVLVSCGSKQYTITSISGQYVPVTQTSRPDPQMTALVSQCKQQMEARMGIVIGKAAQDMSYSAPESLLTNFTSDVMKTLDKSHTGDRPVDLTLMNVHGHRAPIAKGDITVGDVFSTYSFENELVTLTLSGTDLNELFGQYAKMGGAGISGNVRLHIRDGQVVSATIDGKPIDKDKIYTIVTLDYLAEGNDGMAALKKARSVNHTKMTLRDFILDYIKSETARGNVITSKLDGRIVVESNGKK